MTPFEVATLYGAAGGTLLLALSLIRALSPTPSAPGAHLNAAEHVPVVLIVIVLLAFVQAPIVILHATGGLFMAGRVLHAVSFLRSGARTTGRVAGQLLTFASYGVGLAGLCLALAR